MTMAESKDAAQKWLRSQGKCGSKSSDGFLCTITENHTDRMHKAQILGGPEDGRTLKEWDW